MLTNTEIHFCHNTELVVSIRHLIWHGLKISRQLFTESKSPQHYLLASLPPLLKQSQISFRWGNGVSLLSQHRTAKADKSKVQGGGGFMLSWLGSGNCSSPIALAVLLLFLSSCWTKGLSAVLVTARRKIGFPSSLTVLLLYIKGNITPLANRMVTALEWEFKYLRVPHNLTSLFTPLKRLAFQHCLLLNPDCTNPDDH